MADINTIFKITASVVGANAVKELSQNIKGVSTNGQNMARSLAQGALALRAFAASQAVSALKDLVMHSVNLADHLNDVSQRTGVSVEQLAKYKVAADNSGTSIDALAAGFGKLNKNLIEARDGTGPAAGAFRAMGISITDASGQLKNADQITSEMADRFASFPDGPQKAALAMAVFGKSGADLIPLLNQGSEEIKRFGLAIDQDFASASDVFNDKIGVMQSGFSNFGTGVAKELLPALSDAVDAFGGLFGPEMTDAAEMFGKIMGDVTRAIVVGLSFVVKSVKDTIAVIMALGAAAAAVGQMATGDFQGGKAGIVGAKDWALGQLSENERRFDEIVKKNVESSNLYKALGGTVPTVAPSAPRPKLNAGTFRGMEGFDGGKAADKAAGGADAAAKSTERWITKQRESIETLRQEADYIGMTSIEIEKLKDARKLDAEISEKVIGMTSAQADAFRAQAEEIKNARQAVMQYNYEQSRTFGAGAAEFFARYAEEATNAAKQTENALSRAFNGAEDALVDFVTTGKANFRDLANSIIKDLARIVIQQTITGPIASALGGAFGKGGGGAGLFSAVRSFLPFADGGIMTTNGSIPLRAYASGGIANSPQMALFGEGRMPEAYVPLPDGRSIPVSLRGGGGQQNTVTVNVAVEGGTTTKADSKQGADLGNLIASSVKSILVNEKRPGGLLAAA